MIPYARQSISEADIQAVVDVLHSDWLTQGPAVPRFEEAVAERCNVSYAIAVCNATSALHLACAALGVAPGDWVWTSPNSFVASANCALYCGANVDFVDIDPFTFNMSVKALSEKLEDAKRLERLPKAVIPVHFAGQPCEMAAIHALSQEYGFRVIEDASHAIGAQYQGEPVGCGRYSDIAVFSFHPVKIITSGEGGMALTNDAQLAHTLRSLRSHGITRNPALFENPQQGAWDYQQLLLGYNLRMTDIQAALGYSQLQRLPEFLRRRRQLAKRYGELFANLPLQSQRQNDDSLSAWHLYPIRLAEGLDRKKAFDFMRKREIAVNVHYIPIHTQPYYRKLGFMPGSFPQAEKYYSSAISLPLYYELTDSQQDMVASCLSQALEQS